MRLLKDTPFEVGWFPWHWGPGRPALTVVVKATYTLPAEGIAEIADPQEPLSGELHHEDDPELSLLRDTDLAPFKPHGECFVLGSFHAPGGQAVTRSQVAFKIGSVTKNLAVLGDRRWGVSGPTAPKPFTRMPLTWERAFGGPGVDANPMGSGRVKVDVDGEQVVPLPNVEDPLALVQSKRDRPEPAGCAPIPRSFPGRLALAGTYDERWLRERYPFFPADLDWRYFDSAPRDQQIDGYWRGNEDIVLMNLVDGASRVRCGLPGLWPRCLLVSKEGGPSSAPEVTLQLDTITVDGDSRLVTCLFRGPRELSSDSLDDYSHLVVTHDAPGGWRRVEALRELAAELIDRERASEAEHEAEPPPTEVLPFGLEGPSAEGVESKWAKIDQAMTMQADGPSADLAQAVAEQLRRHGADMNALGAFGASLAPFLGQAPVERPIDEDELKAVEARVLSEEEDRWRSGEGVSLRRRVLAALAESEPCAGWDLSHADLSKLQITGGDFRGAIFTGANLAGTTFTGCTFDEAAFTEAELSDANFHGTTFNDAAIHFCRLERTHFVESNLDDGTVTDSFLRDARLSRCFARRIDLHGSHLERTTFDDSVLDGADFSGAWVDEALFARTSLVDARLIDGASAKRVRLDRCDISLLRAFGTDFERSHFAACVGNGARFGGATLGRADFSFSELDRADFSGADLREAKLMACRLRGARFDDAKLERASLIRADLYEARFEGADLAGADLRGASLFRAELWRAKLDGANLELTLLEGTRLAR